MRAENQPAWTRVSNGRPQDDTPDEESEWRMEPRSDLCVQVMARLNKNASQQTRERRPSPERVSPPLRQFLENLGVLLACAGFLVSVRPDLSAQRFIEFVANPYFLQARYH